MFYSFNVASSGTFVKQYASCSTSVPGICSAANAALNAGAISGGSNSTSIYVGMKYEFSKTSAEQLWYDTPFIASSHNKFSHNTSYHNILSPHPLVIQPFLILSPPHTFFTLFCSFSPSFLLIFHPLFSHFFSHFSSFFCSFFRYLFFCYLWTMNFIAGIGTLVIAVCVARWYFTTPDERAKVNSPLVVIIFDHSIMIILMTEMID